MLGVPALLGLQSGHAVTYAGRRPGVELVRRLVAPEASVDLDGPGAAICFREAADGTFDRIICVGPPPFDPGHTPFTQLSTKAAGQRKWREWCAAAGVGEPHMPLATTQPGPPALLIAPGSGSLDKNWPTKYFARLASEHAQHAEVFVLMGPAEEERGLLDHWRGLGGPGRIVQSPGPDDLLALFRRAPLFLGNDSGLTHLAGLFDLRGIVIFTASDPAVWAPPGTRLRLLGGPGHPPEFEEIEQALEREWRSSAICAI